jgi:DNA-binding transcriptional LysR family regulator
MRLSFAVIACAQQQGWGVNLQQLRYFVVTATELNFRRSAELLFLSQPALSRQIAALERDLGVSLLRRDRRHVEITEAGKVLLDEARALLAHADQAARRTTIAAGLDRPRIRVGVPTRAPAVIYEALEELGKSERRLRIEAEELPHDARLKRLVNGQLDAAFINASLADHSVDFVALQSFSRVAVVHVSHRLAAAGEAPLSALADENILVLSNQPALVEQLRASCLKAGFEPKLTLVDEAQWGLSLSLRLAAEQAVCLWSVEFAPLPPSTSIIRVPGLPDYVIGLAWRAGEEPGGVNALASIVRHHQSA